MSVLLVDRIFINPDQVCMIGVAPNDDIHMTNLNKSVEIIDKLDENWNELFDKICTQLKESFYKFGYVIYNKKFLKYINIGNTAGKKSYDNGIIYSSKMAINKIDSRLINLDNYYINPLKFKCIRMDGEKIKLHVDENVIEIDQSELNASCTACAMYNLDDISFGSSKQHDTNMRNNGMILLRYSCEFAIIIPRKNAKKLRATTGGIMYDDLKIETVTSPLIIMSKIAEQLKN